MAKSDAAPELTPEEIEKKRAELVAQLDALPLPPSAKGLRPGTVVGEGLSAEYVPFTKEYFLDIEARRKEDPNYQLHEVIASQTMPIIVNGVSFTVLGGIPCKLPTPHYMVYRNWLDNFRKMDAEFAPPENPGRNAGYISPVHRMPGVWSKEPIQS